MKYEYSYHDRRKYFWNIIFKIIGIIIIVFIISLPILDINSKREILIGFLAVFSFIFITHMLPLMILFINHWNKSKHAEVVFDTVSKLYSIKLADGQMLEFSEGSISSIQQVMSPPQFDNRTDWLFFGVFFYWVLNTKSDGSIKISCLVCDDNNIFNPSKIQKKKKFFPII